MMTEQVFVARERELAQLNEFLGRALASQGQVAFVTGEAGSGKTALVTEFARRAQEAHPDLIVATGQCDAQTGVGDPYLPFREVLGLLTGDVESKLAQGAITQENAGRLRAFLRVSGQALVNLGPDLVEVFVPGVALATRAGAFLAEKVGWLDTLEKLTARRTGDVGFSGVEQSHIFEQYTNVLNALAADRPLMLVVDDLQWADAASIGLLFRLGRRVGESRVLIVGAYRPAEVALGRGGERHPLEKVLAEFKRYFGDVWVDLSQATEAEGRGFMEAFLDTEPNRLGEGFRQALFRHTGGHALFTLELLRDMQERGDLVQDEQGQWVEGPALEWGALPARVEGVIEERIGRLEEQLRETLTIASVEGEDFTAEVVARVQAVDERGLVRRLSGELDKQHRLVRERGIQRLGRQRLSLYRFQHNLFQKYLYSSLGEVERAYLHEDVGNVLEALYGDQAEEIAVQLARHFEEAGVEEKAIDYMLKAGNRARRLYAHEEAIDYFRRALEWLDASPLGRSRKDWRLEALKGLGQIYFWIVKLAEAEQYLREAIALGQETGLSVRELVWLYYWLGEVLWWQGRHDDRIHVGEEGLALLADEAVESVEAALMIQLIAMGHLGMGNLERWRECAYRTAQFIQRLPYSENLRPTYNYVAHVYVSDKNVEKAVELIQVLERNAEQHHDLRAAGEVHLLAGLILQRRGDYHGAISRRQQAVEVFMRTGNPMVSGCLGMMGEAYRQLGDLQMAEEYGSRALEMVESVGNRAFVAGRYEETGRTLFCQGAWEQAIDAFQQAAQLYRELEAPRATAGALMSVGRVYLVQGKRPEALKQFQGAMALLGQDTTPARFSPESRSPFTEVLSGLEEAYEDAHQFQAFCHRFRARYRAEHPEVGESPLVQWFLEPTEPLDCPQHLVRDDFVGTLSSEWIWEDPFDDCSYTVQDGLEIHAANGRDLWHINLSAPRVVRPVSPVLSAVEGGDFAVQTVCVPASADQPVIGAPAIGGLLLWKEKENYLRLDKGTRGEHEISFGGCLENKDVIIGRGRLPFDAAQDGPAERVFLRLERIGHRVNALCSADGVDWFTVGHVEFPVEDPVEVGLHAIGEIDRTIYHGAYPDGTAIVFESFELWG